MKIMKSTPQLRIIILIISLIVGLLPIDKVVAEENSKQPVTRENLISAAREIIQSANYCALITIGEDGDIAARAMEPFPPEDDMTVWLGTKSNSRKVEQIRKNSNVSLYYFAPDKRGYVTISGTAELINEPKMKSKWWREKWKQFYPNRETDYLLIKVTPASMEVISYVLGITGDKNTWAAPTVKFD